MAGRYRTQRSTRNSQKTSLEEDDLHLMLSQSQSSRDVTMSHSNDDDDDLRLFLSQSQDKQPALTLDDSMVNDLAATAANMKINISQVESIIRKNKNILVKQNEKVLKLIYDMSVSVDEISERVGTIERKLRVINNTVNTNKDEINHMKTNVHKLQNSVNMMQKRYGSETKQNEYETRLKRIEDKLREENTIHQTSQNNATESQSNNTMEDEHKIHIKNLRYGQQDEEDVIELVREGLGLDIRPHAVNRAPSVHNNAGIITVTLSSSHDKELIMRNKRKLKYTDRYYNVYIDSTNTQIYRRIENKFKQLINYMHGRERSMGRHEYYRNQYSNRSQYNTQ